MTDTFPITPYFLLQPHQGKLLFILSTIERLKSDRAREPIWYTQLNDDDDFEDVCVWLGEHQPLWPEWCRIAESEGMLALHEHIARMYLVDPIEQAQRIVISEGDHPLEVEIFVHLVTRTAEIGSHKFADENELAKFMEFMIDGGSPPAGWSQVVATELNDRDHSSGVAYAWALVQEACLGPAGSLPKLIAQVTSGTTRRGPTAKAQLL